MSLGENGMRNLSELFMVFLYSNYPKDVIHRFNTLTDPDDIFFFYPFCLVVDTYVLVKTFATKGLNESTTIFNPIFNNSEVILI